MTTRKLILIAIASAVVTWFAFNWCLIFGGRPYYQVPAVCHNYFK